MTPQEKKKHSYAKDRRNTYFADSKATRKGVPLAKARGLRLVRHQQDQMLAQAARTAEIDQLEDIENQVRGAFHRWWKKWPDKPLGVVLAWRGTGPVKSEA